MDILKGSYHANNSQKETNPGKKIDKVNFSGFIKELRKNSKLGSVSWDSGCRL